jgi:uncharacterized protein YjbJ (UPF0337 family)
VGAKTKQWKGRIKLAIGSLTGNKKLEREGRADRRAGEAEERLAEAQGKVDELIDKAADAAKGVIGTGKGTPRRR